ncbi:MAG: T9SS type A sorting domain-containing protein [Bacteroidetes bacterium]|jgi:hypothetical protein|nr:T9SS type A sorting domain-containing protein [Bacteroidota bacterium]
MKLIINLYRYSLFAALLATSLFAANTISGQTSEPGINFIMVTFDQQPTEALVEKSPLRYNKKFALSFHTDDGIGDVFSVGFPFFTGINTGNTNHPGLFYTDGCGNTLSFKISTALFSFSSYNGLDMHDPANGFTNVTWDQMALMYENGSGIYNHGVSEDGSSGDFMHYSIRRNESYIRRKLYGVTAGGVRTRVLVNPNGNQDYTQAAFDNGYRTAFRIGGQVISDNGVDVTNFTDWNQNLELNRRSAEDSPVPDLADFMATAEGNWWLPMYGHSITLNYGETKFYNDFNTLADNYGMAGQDNIWMTSEEEILDYLRIRELTEVVYNVAGTSMLILLEGAIPNDQRFYPLSLNLQVTGATITNISINGGTNNSYNGVGTSSALINLEWNGREIEDPAIVADSMVTIAEQTQTQYDCSIAMDYVLMVPEGDEQQALKDRLCAIPDVEYESGFCEVCTFTLGDDMEICQGECVSLEAPIGEGNTYLWSNDSTTQSITVCPDITTTYWVELITAGGCEASDTITISVLEAPVFDFGPDQDICQGDSISFELPFSEDYTYLWIADDDTLAANTNTYGFVVQDSVQLVAEIGSPNGCISTDTVLINALLSPVFDFDEFIEGCQNDTTLITGPAGEGFQYDWLLDGELLADTTMQLQLLITDTAMLVLEVTAPSGCLASDSVWLYPLDTPEIDFPQDIQVCMGDTLFLEAPQGDNYLYAWYAGDELLDETSFELAWMVTDTTSIKLEVFAPSGCMAADSILVFALDVPLIEVTPALSELCFGEGITLQLNAQNADGFEWWNGITAQSIDFLPTVTDTTYNLWAEAYNGYGCTARDTAVVAVYSHPQILLEIETGGLELCMGDSLSLNVSSNNHIMADKVVWNETDTVFFGNETILNKVFTPNESGWIKAEIFSDQGCMDSDSMYISVFENPQITVSDDQDICLGESIQLEATGGFTCKWYNNNGLIGESYLLELQPDQTTVYWAVVENSAPLYCSATDTVEVIVRDKPEVLVNASANDICAGFGVVLNASGAETYEWSTGESGSQISVQPTDTTSYTVIGMNQFGCSDTAVLVLNVFPSTDLTITGLLPVYCQSDDPSPLTGLPAGGLFSGPGMVAGTFYPELAGDGVHQIVYRYSNEYECTDSIFVTTRVFGGLSSIDLGADSAICPNDTLRLDAGEGFSQYFWNTGETTQQITILGTDYQTGTSREISVVGVLDGCTASGNMQLTVLEDCFIGMPENEATDGLYIAPNPGNGDFQLFLAYDIRVKLIELYDLSGRQLSDKLRLVSCNDGACNFVIDRTMQGWYILKVFTNKGVFTKSLIMQ